MPHESSGELVPVPRPPTVETSTRGAAPVGQLLEKARKRLGLSVEAVCEGTMLSPRELHSFESSLRTPPQGDLERLADFYEVEVDRFLPGAKAETRHDDRNHRVLWLGWASIDLGDDLDQLSNAQVLARLTHTIRSIRSMGEDAPLTIRDAELATIGGVLRLDDPDLLTDLMAYMRLSTKQAVELLARLQHAIATTKQLPEASSVDVPAGEGDPYPTAAEIDRPVEQSSESAGA